MNPTNDGYLVVTKHGVCDARFNSREDAYTWMAHKRGEEQARDERARGGYDSGWSVVEIPSEVSQLTIAKTSV